MLRMKLLNVLHHITFLIELHGACFDRTAKRLLVRMNPQVRKQFTHAREYLVTRLSRLIGIQIRRNISELTAFNQFLNSLVLRRIALLTFSCLYGDRVVLVFLTVTDIAQTMKQLFNSHAILLFQNVDNEVARLRYMFPHCARVLTQHQFLHSFTDGLVLSIRHLILCLMRQIALIRQVVETDGGMN